MTAQKLMENSIHFIQQSRFTSMCIIKCQHQWIHKTGYLSNYSEYQYHFFIKYNTSTTNRRYRDQRLKVYRLINEEEDKYDAKKLLF